MYDIFADIILPLKLQGTFTYKVPTDFALAIKPGHRVVVQFGRQQKMYTAIVLKVHRNKPELGIVKSILALADEEPVVLPLQLQFWQWMAGYYLCTPGEVMNAALPSALKLDSTTVVELDRAATGSCGCGMATSGCGRKDWAIMAAHLQELHPVPGPLP